MKSIPNPLPANFLKKSPPEGLQEMCSLLDLDAAPVALIETESKKILFANRGMLAFCGFNDSEAIDKPARTLFPSLEINKIGLGESMPILVAHKDQAPNQITADLQLLDGKLGWLYVRIPQTVAKENQSPGNVGGSYRQLLELAQVTDFASLPLALTRAAEILQQVSGAESICIYQADAEFPKFLRVAEAGSGREFPEELPSLDSMRLSSTVLWTPGMRVLTDLHRFGRTNNYQYIASTPLGEPSALVGLVVCAGRDAQPEGINDDLLETIRMQIGSVQQHYLLIENLQKENRSYARMVNLLNAAFSNIGEGIVLLTSDLTIQHINPAAEWILGYNSAEVQGQEYGNVLIGTDRIAPALDEARKGLVTHNIGKVTLNRRNGQSFPAQVQVLPVMMKDVLVGIEVILNDISENENNKALTQHLEHRALIGDFTAAFAHDIRNPINNIVTGLQLLAMKIPADDPNQEIVARIQGDCTRLNHLMESFLAFSRMNDMHFEPVDIGAFLTKTLDRWHPRLMRENITPVVQIDENLDKMNGDPRALDRVFTNLISNAVDAMTTSGDTLAVKACMNREVSGLNLVEVSISDNGPGIPDDIKDRIFEPFVSTNSQKGTGLGLAITKQIVTALKGSIRVNTFPGGTVFTVSIPAWNGELK
jgi:two-component system, NtrC family, sensor histidine kinase AtoS